MNHSAIIETRAAQLDEIDLEREKLLHKFEDALMKANDGGVSISELARIASMRRERIHYAIQRARGRKNGG